MFQDTISEKSKVRKWKWLQSVPEIVPHDRRKKDTNTNGSPIFTLQRRPERWLNMHGSKLKKKISSEFSSGHYHRHDLQQHLKASFFPENTSSPFLFLLCNTLLLRQSEPIFLHPPPTCYRAIWYYFSTFPPRNSAFQLSMSKWSSAVQQAKAVKQFIILFSDEKIHNLYFSSNIVLSE